MYRQTEGIYCQCVNRREWNQIEPYYYRSTSRRRIESNRISNFQTHNRMWFEFNANWFDLATEFGVETTVFYANRCTVSSGVSTTLHSMSQNFEVIIWDSFTKLFPHLFKYQGYFALRKIRNLQMTFKCLAIIEQWMTCDKVCYKRPYQTEHRRITLLRTHLWRHLLFMVFFFSQNSVVSRRRRWVFKSYSINQRQKARLIQIYMSDELS